MDIKLKQAEITKAIRDYVADKIGINLTGKHLGIDFSMGRGTDALIANLSITEADEVDVPGFTDRPAEAESAVSGDKPKAQVVDLKDAKAGTVGAALSEAKDEKAVEPAEVQTNVPAEEVKDAPAADADTSLFNS